MKNKLTSREIKTMIVNNQIVKITFQGITERKVIDLFNNTTYEKPYSKKETMFILMVQDINENIYMLRDSNQYSIRIFKNLISVNILLLEIQKLTNENVRVNLELKIRFNDFIKTELKRKASRHIKKGKELTRTRTKIEIIGDK